MLTKSVDSVSATGSTISTNPVPAALRKLVTRIASGDVTATATTANVPRLSLGEGPRERHKARQEE